MVKEFVHIWSVMSALRRSGCVFHTYTSLIVSMVQCSNPLTIV